MTEDVRGKSLTKGFIYPYTKDSVQLLQWSGKRTSIAFAGSTMNVALPTNTEVMELSATEHCYIAFGGAGVTATTTIADDASRLYLGGVQQVPVPIDPATDLPYTHIAALQLGTAGILQIERVS